MDELRAMLENSYLQNSLMHKFFSSRVRELEEACVILKQKTTKIVNDKNEAIKKNSNTIECICRDLSLELEKLLGTHRDTLGEAKVEVGDIAQMLSVVIERMKKLVFAESIGENA